MGLRLSDLDDRSRWGSRFAISRSSKSWSTSSTGPAAEATHEALSSSSEPGAIQDPDVFRRKKPATRLRTGRTDLIVVAGACRRCGRRARTTNIASTPRGRRACSRAARVDDQLQRAAGRRDVAEVKLVPVDEPGGRYIDFLVPGLLGMSLMGGGLWGVGFVTVDMRRAQAAQAIPRHADEEEPFPRRHHGQPDDVHDARGADPAGVRSLCVRRR